MMRWMKTLLSVCIDRLGKFIQSLAFRLAPVLNSVKESTWYEYIIQRRIFLLAGFGIFLLVVIGYLGFHSGGSNGTARAEETPPMVKVSRGDVIQSISAPGQLVGTRRNDLRMSITGEVAEIHVQPGTPVKKDQPLLVIGDKAKFEAAVTSAHVEFLQAQQELEDVRAAAPEETASAHLELLTAEENLNLVDLQRESLKYPRASQERLDGLNAEIQEALKNVALAQDRYDATIYLPGDDPRRYEALKALTAAQTKRDDLKRTYNWLVAKPTEKDFAEADAKVAQAKAAYENAQRRWERVKDGPDRLKLELAEAKIADMQVRYTKAQADLAGMTLVAPFDGVITDVMVRVGDEITPESVAMTISDPMSVEAQVTVVEEDYAYVQPGQKAELFFDALPDADVSGQVTRIVPERVAGDRPLYPVYIQLVNVPQGLAPGMTVDASILIAESKNKLVLPK